MAEMEKKVTDAPAKPKVTASPATVALRKVVSDVYGAAWAAKERGEPIGWSSSKFPTESCETLGLAVV